MNKTVLYVSVAVIITALVVGGGVWYFIKPAPVANALEIYHWWTAAGEKEAIDALIGVYHEKYPNVTIIQSPVAGGAGIKMKALMKTLVLGGEAPDAFQIHAGYETLPYYEADLLEPITDLWMEVGEDGKKWIDVFPTVVQEMVKWGEEYYAVPVNIHRVNIIWYNKAIFETNNIIVPDDVDTWDEFWTTCETLVDAGVTPIALGDKYKWPAMHVFEQIMASEPQVYEDFINGNVTSAQLEPILTKFKKYLSYVNTDHSDLTWDEACGKVYAGDCAMTLMGDWAKGYFTKKDWNYGVEFEAFKPPGTADKFGLCIDCFEHCKSVKHPENSLNWLRVVGSIEGQNAFNPIKGSIAARIDAPLDPYDDYSRMCVTELNTSAVLYPSIAHGSGSPEGVASPLNDKISEFVEAQDVSASATAIANLVTSVEHIKTWDII